MRKERSATIRAKVDASRYERLKRDNRPRHQAPVTYVGDGDGRAAERLRQNDGRAAPLTATVHALDWHASDRRTSVGVIRPTNSNSIEGLGG